MTASYSFFSLTGENIYLPFKLYDVLTLLFFSFCCCCCCCWCCCVTAAVHLISYDVVVTSHQQAIVDDFKSFKGNVVFSAETYCWPDRSLEPLYPPVNSSGKRYLNSGAFIGYAPIVYEIVSSSDISNTDDDQLFYTRIYLNETLRNKYQIKLDHRSKLFQNLNGAFGEVELKLNRHDAYIVNTFYNSHPKIIHGNGASKMHLNSLANYLARSWTLDEGCVSCFEEKNEQLKRDTNEIDTMKRKSSGEEDESSILHQQEPVNVLMCLFVEHATPFLEEFFEDIERLNVSKARMSVRIHNSQKYHRKHVQDFVDRTVSLYRSIKVVDLTMPQWQARNLCLWVLHLFLLLHFTLSLSFSSSSLNQLSVYKVPQFTHDFLLFHCTFHREQCLMDECSFYLSVDSEARLTDANTVNKLIATGK